MQHRSSQMSFSVPQITPVVKYLLIINVLCWLIGVVILQGYVFEQKHIFYWLGMIPESTVFDFKLWQPLTYMFFHSPELNHILFNSLLLWFIGSSIEVTLGSRHFLKYYLVCGVGAAWLYIAVLYGLYYFVGMNSTQILYSPVVGASGAVFGLLVAYGILHGDNIIYFLMLFPMKAKYFVSILVLIELYVLMTSGFSGPVANLAHVGGIIVGVLYLWLETLRRKFQRQRSHRSENSNLKLIINNKKKKNNITYH